MNFKKITSEDRRSIIWGLAISLILLSILVVGAIANYNTVDTLIALSVSQLGIALLWLTVRLGLYSTSSFGSRKYAKTQLEKKNNKIGVYDDSKKSKFDINNYNSPIDIEENSQSKSKFGIYVMFIIGSLELIISLIIAYN